MIKKGVGIHPQFKLQIRWPKIFLRSPQKSTHKAAYKSKLTRHPIVSVLDEQLNYRPWKPLYVLELEPEDCDQKVKYGMLRWHEDLTPWDIYLWDYIKEEVYKTKPCLLEEL